VDLVGVEHGIGLEDAPGFLGGLAGLARFNFLGVALVEDGDGGLLALAHLAPELLRLVVGHPERRGVAAHVGDHPQPEHVHAAIRRAAGAQWTGDGYAAPGLEPWSGAGLEPRNDFMSDAR